MRDPDPDAPTLDAAAFERLLLDPDVPEKDLRPYLVVDEAGSDPFRPVVMANPARVHAPATEAAVALSSLNGIARWRRAQHYRRQIEGWTGVRIVSEGDSWFQYPLLLTDVIDWLSEAYAIHSLDAAGDLLTDMVQQGELVTAVVQDRPHVILLSGGGNDLLGGSRLSRAILPFEAGRLAQDYLGAALDANLRAAIADYERLFTRLAQVAPDTPILCHVYDHAIPVQGRWLGRPLADIGIVDPGLQRDIVRAIVDRFHAALTGLAGRFARVRVIDTRGAVGNTHWHDELHPTDRGYAAVARLFAAEIATVTETQPSELATEAAAVEGVILESSAEEERLLTQLDRYSEDALLHEIGRRETLAQAGDPQPEPVAVYPSSVEGAYPAFRREGLRVLATAGQAAAGDPSRAELERALQGPRPSLMKYLVAMQTQARAPDDQALLVAALLARRAEGADAEALRRRWMALLDPRSGD